MTYRGATSRQVSLDAKTRQNVKVALVCDWLTNVGGAEKVLLKLHRMYPKAPIYTSKYTPEKIDWFKDADVRTGWLQIFPSFLRRFLGAFRARYFAKLDLSEYDLVISVTGAEAKAVKTTNSETGKSAVHISYCHVPTQYYWQMYDSYLKNPGFGVLNPVVRVFFKKMVGKLRQKDFEAAQRVDQFVTISEYAKEMIEKYYQREAVVVWPPVEVMEFRRDAEALNFVKDDVSKAQDKVTEACRSTFEVQGTTLGVRTYYVTTSRQVTWKRLDLAVKACVELGRNLVVVGEGPEHKNLMKLARGNAGVKFLPLMGKRELAKVLAGAKGYLFPSLEPFGIAPVEAMAAGCPVISYGEGGAKDYVKEGVNGVMFKWQTVKSLKEAIVEFEGMEFDKKKVMGSVKEFEEGRFEKEMRRVVSETMRK